MRRRKAQRIVPGHEPVLAAGVRGYKLWSRGELYVPLIIADRPGNGDVGRFLDALPKDRVVKVPTVTSARLAGMLARRGFAEAAEMTPMGVCELWIRSP